MKTKRFLIGLLVAIFAILGNPKERLFAQDGVKITDTTNVNSSSEDLSILEMINASNDVNGTNEETDRIIKEKINTKIEKGFVDSILPLANLLVPDRKSTRLNSSLIQIYRMPSSA